MKIKCLIGYHVWEFYWSKWIDTKTGNKVITKFKCKHCSKFKTVGDVNCDELYEIFDQRD